MTLVNEFQKEIDKLKDKINQIFKEIVPITKTSLMHLFGLGPDAYTLYSFYVKNSIIQNNLSVYSTDNFCMKGLNWGKIKFRRAKKILVDSGFIENVVRKDKDGKITKYYILLHYVISNNEPIDHKPQDGCPVDSLPVVRNQTINTIDKKENTIDKKENTRNKNLNANYTHISEIFNHWNNKEIVKHQELTDTIHKNIIKALRLITPEELKRSIDSYNDILKSQEYFFSYKWSLSDFLSRGTSKIGIEERKGFWMFTDNNKPYQTFNRYNSEDKFVTIKSKFKPISTVYNPQELLSNNTYYGFEVDMINNTERLHDVKERIRKSKHTYSDFWELEVVIAGLIFRRKHEDNLELAEVLVDLWMSLKNKFEEIAARNREDI